MVNKYFQEGNKVFRWSLNGTKELIEEYDSEEEAKEYLIETFLIDYENNEEAPPYFETKEEAEKELNRF